MKYFIQIVLAFLLCVGASLLIDRANSRSTIFSGGNITSSTTITSATFGTLWAYNQYYPTNSQTVNGDGWNTTWDDMGRIITVGNDWSGSWTSAGSGSQIGFSLLTNTARDTTTLGSVLNGMGAWDGASPPGGTWKDQGIISVGGVLHSLVGNVSNSCIGCFVFMQVISSTDHGVTFTPTPPYSSPMFSTTLSPYTFIQYGQNYTGNGPDNSGTYIYAIGTGNNGTFGGPYLARVAISLIGNHSAGDWQWWQGGDGMVDANWSTVQTTAAAIPSTGFAPNNMQYLPRYGKYFSINVNWNFVSPPSTTYNVVCDHPWGPCAQLGSSSSWGQAFYGWSIAPSSLVNGGQQIIATMAGDFHSGGATGLYTLWMVPLVLTP